MKHISRGTGRSVTAAAAYRSASLIQDERTGRCHDYSAKRGVLSSIILAPSRAPEWAHDPEQLWNRVEHVENRKDSRLARENIVALPHELNLDQNTEWLHRFVNDNYVKRGMVAQVSIHGPDQDGDNRNIHAHILLTDRQVTRNGFKAKKAPIWNTKSTLFKWREAFADYQNQALEEHGHQSRVDHRSYKDRGIDREPTQHLGPAANQIERDDNPTDIGKKNQLKKEFNRNLDTMKELVRQLEAEIEAHQEAQFKKQLQTEQEQQRKQQTKQDQLDAKMKSLQKDDVEGKLIPTDPYGDLAKLDRKNKLEAKHRSERYKLDAQLKDLYQREEKEREFKQARQQLRANNNWWANLTGHKAQAERDLEAARLNLENVRMREKGYREALKIRQTAERETVIGPQPDAEPRPDFNRAAHGIAPRQKPEVANTEKPKEQVVEPLRAKRLKPIAKNELQPLPGYQGPMRKPEPKQVPQKTMQAHKQQHSQMPKIETTRPAKVTANDNQTHIDKKEKFNTVAAQPVLLTEEAKETQRETRKQEFLQRMRNAKGQSKDRDISQ